MPQLPDKFALGAMPGGGDRALALMPTGRDAVDAGAGLKALGSAVSEVGGVIQAKFNEADDYTVQKSLNDFDLAQEKRLIDAKHNAPPGGEGLADSYRKGYDEDARKLMERVPPRLRQKVDSVLVNKGAQYEEKAYRFQEDEKTRYHVDDVKGKTEEYLGETSNNPDLRQSNADRISALWAASKVPTRFKLKGMRDALEANDEAAARTELDRIQSNKDLTDAERESRKADLLERLRKAPSSSFITNNDQGTYTGKPFSPAVESAIAKAAEKTGADPAMLRAFARIESGGDPGNRTGSYKGLFQLSNSEFSKHGGAGNIYDPVANAEAAAVKLQAESQDFERKYGRTPTASEIYLIHQQGEAGAGAHWANPDRPAWQNMASTGEGRQKGAGWAKQAIWGNVPGNLKAKFGSVENITSRDFVELWDSKVQRLGGGSATKKGEVKVAELQPASASGTVATDANDQGTTIDENDQGTDTGSPKLPDTQDEPVADDGAVDYQHLSLKRRRTLMRVIGTSLRADVESRVNSDIERLRRGQELPVDADGKTSIDRAGKYLTGHQSKVIADKAKAAKFEYETLGATTGLSDDEQLAWAAQTWPRAEAAGVPLKEAAAIEKKQQTRIAQNQKLRSTDPAAAVSGYPVEDEDGTKEPPLPATRAALAAIRASRASDTVVDASGQRVPTGKPKTMMTPQQEWDVTFEARLADQASIMPDRPYAHKIITKREAAQLLQMDSKSIANVDNKIVTAKLKEAADRAEQTYGKKWGKRAFEEAIALQLPGGSDERKSIEAKLAASIATGRAIDKKDFARLDALDQIDRLGRPATPMPTSPAGSFSMPAIAGTQAVPTKAQEDILRKNPQSVGVFDQLFGKGAGARVLAGDGLEVVNPGTPKDYKPKKKGWFD